MVTDASPVHPRKALPSISVTLSGMVTEVSPVQHRKAKPPIWVTLPGMVTDVSPVQPSKAPSTISVTLSGMVTSPRNPSPGGDARCDLITPWTFWLSDIVKVFDPGRYFKKNFIFFLISYTYKVSYNIVNMIPMVTQ